MVYSVGAFLTDICFQSFTIANNTAESEGKAYINLLVVANAYVNLLGVPPVGCKEFCIPTSNVQNCVFLCSLGNTTYCQCDR